MPGPPPATSPTNRQLEILATIFILTEERGGLRPTLKEIGQRLGMRSKCGAQTGVEALQRYGLVERVPTGQRTLSITVLGLAVLGEPEPEQPTSG